MVVVEQPCVLVSVLLRVLTDENAQRAMVQEYWDHLMNRRRSAS
jgi:hypothetical protein